MAIVKPFKGLLPPTEIVEELSCLPYDVMNSKEAAGMTEGKPRSLLHITHAEIDCPDGTDIHSETVYLKAADTFRSFREKGWLKQDPLPRFYIYAQTMGNRTQVGLVGCAACSDYENGIIRKHELTRPDKEEDRMVLTRYLNANIEPVFFSYKAVPEMDTIVQKIVASQPAQFTFVAEDGFGHHFWTITDPETNAAIEKLFADKVPFTYVADGHHRTAAAARIGTERKLKNPSHTGNEEYNYFMAVHFPDNQLQIMDYNRVVRELNGFSPEDFLNALEKAFFVEHKGMEEYKPDALHTFSMYLESSWYKLKARPGTFNDLDPIGVLDVTILSEQVLKPLLGIEDLRTSQRIDFIGGIRGLGELKRRVDSGEMKVAFALFPVSMEQLINIADSGNIMPPKTTWFEPKLRSGLVIHLLES
jgi:uncharacterized protein (DUF1015 family)